MKEKSVKAKSYDLTLKIIETYLNLTQEQQDFFLTKQLLRSSTSAGLKLEDLKDKDSKKDLLLKITLSIREVKETSYLLRVLKDIGYLPELQYIGLIEDCNDLFTSLQQMNMKVRRFSF